MDKIKVILKHITPEFVVNEAVGMPYDTPPSSELTSKVIGIKKHLSCAEHVVLNFHIIGSSRHELQQHVRHRIASPTVKSTRYALQKVLNSSDMKDIFLELDLSKLSTEQHAAFFAKQQFIELTAYNSAKELMAMGIHNDYVAYLMPETLRTALSWTINLRSFINFLELRTDKHAHFEIRHIANKMRMAIGEELEAKYVDKILAQMEL